MSAHYPSGHQCPFLFANFVLMSFSCFCRTTKEDEEAARREEDEDAELDALLNDDSILEVYMQKRMKEMMEKNMPKKT